MSKILSGFIEEAFRVVNAAEERKIILRLIGAVASRIHCPNYGYIQDKLGRAFSDIDYVSYSRFKEDIKKLFVELGYTYDEIMAKVFAVEFGHVNRFIFNDPIYGRHSDVFFDKLEFSHDIPIENRLEIDFPTLPLAELLLTKMQIAKLTEKDVVDAVMLIREHEIGSSDKEIINSTYIAKLCSEDWGLWKTVTGNLQKVKELLPSFKDLTQQDVEDVKLKIDKILESIEKHPKTLKWRMRAKIGERKKWYREVEEVSREYT
ncbi:MAG: hypothetical protein QXN81_03755 [Candidatus Bathyarchaeia archaeon]